MFEYLARAKVEFGVEGTNQPDLDVDIQRVIEDSVAGDKGDYISKRKEKTRISEEFPVKFDPFTMDKSPNEGIYYKLAFGEIGKLEADLKADEAFPVSILYVDACVKTEEAVKRYVLVEKLFSQLEALMRLFQEGHIYIRLHALWKVEAGKLVEDDTIDTAFATGEDYFAFYAPRPEPTNRYFIGLYDMSDSKLKDFWEFFNRYWAILQGKPQKKPNPIQIALLRFSSSYEKMTLTDRLIELMIAMEAMFGDREYHTYKIPLRCACLLFPPGEARKGAFERIKKMYDARSRILHGEHLETKYTNEDIRAFEDLVRKSILKFMQYQVNGRQIPSSTELDEILFLGTN